MIVKERQMPIYLRHRRLPAHHPKRDMIVESLAKHKAGIVRTVKLSLKWHMNLL
ncbi:hypothetical protein MQW34_25390 [Bacillus sp. ZJS3]|uniref:hypothetical protein n=1 Tax=Bacillus sp. ZJS3 TaxID=2928154 RepID=UPI001FB44FF9|nr:hypothetical protein [Bacillus sp. ZJS3]UOB78725.1 hypothetical protein MQW34_25390 [Bacillus sp. ZJS3]